MAKDSLLRGTFILMGAAFVARFLGLIQRVPLKHILGDDGMATYTIAYNIYFILLIIATAGIPSALSKLVSERNATGRHGETKRIFQSAVWFAIAAGLLITAVLLIFAPYIADQSNDPGSVIAIRALAPALLFFPLIAIMRGYFQGRQMMLGNGISQIIEQILRVAASVGLAYLLLVYGFGIDWIAAGASFGGVAGSIGALWVMLYYYRKLMREDAGETRETRDESTAPFLKRREIYGLIFKLSIPISIISIAVPLIYVIDSTTVIGLLKDKFGFIAAKTVLGQLGGRAQSFAGIPPILAIALSQSIVPIVSAAYARSDFAEVSRRASQVIRVSILSGLPVVLLLTLSSSSLNGLLFGDTLATSIIAWMVIGSLFQIIMMTSAAVLMGLGKMRAPMIHVFIGILVKFAGNFVLTPWFGINGILAATTLSFIVMMVLNLKVLKKETNYRLLGRRWIGLSLTTTVMCGAGIGLRQFTNAVIHPFEHLPRLDYALQSIIICSVLAVLYPALLYIFRVVTAEDVNSFPGPLKKLIARAQKLLKR